MASSHGPYDSRQRPSRHDAYYHSSRPRHEDCLKPTAGANETRRGVGESPGERRGEAYPAQRSPSRYAYNASDARSVFLRTDARDTSRRVPARVRKRRSWPPPPACEDEAVSIAREAGSQRLLRELGKDDIPSRGSIDQEPVVQEVPDLINRDERRFVLRPHASAEQPTPPTSEDEKLRRKARRRPSKLDTAIPEMSRRTASPYAFSNTERKREPSFSGRFLSPDELLSPPPTDTGSRRTVAGSRSQPPSPRRDSAKFSAAPRRGDYFTTAGESAIDDSESDNDRRAGQKAGTWPASRDVPNQSSRTSVVDFAPPPPPPIGSASIRRANLDARRNTDSESTLPTLQRLNIDKLRRPGASTTNSAFGGLGVPVVDSPRAVLPGSDFARPRSRDSSHHASKCPSPAGSTTGGATPQRSPRMSAEWSKEDVYDRPPTRGSSVSGSRPQSPSPRTPADSPRLPKTELDWSTLLAANTNRRSMPPSRLSTSIQQDYAPQSSRGHMRQSSSTTAESLPYPIDDGPSTPSVWMPSETAHQFYPDVRLGSHPTFLREPQSNYRPPAAGPAAAPANSPYLSNTGTRPTRPPFPTRHSTADVPPASRDKQYGAGPTQQGKRPAAMPSSQTKKELQALAKKPLPPCDRVTPVAGHTDWYALVAAPTLEFCPDCVSEVFDRTIYRNMFRRSPPRRLETEIRCALGSMPWVRLAWLMTLHQQRADLRLLEDLADVEDSSVPCPGDLQAARPWYGLRNKDGIFVRDFRICYSDVRKIEALMPTLSGVFVRLPQRTADEVGLCSIRPQGSRFSIYIDALLAAHEKATVARASPDMGPFISLVQWRSRMRECSKDNLIKNGLWHFMEALPELTVCEGK